MNTPVDILLATYNGSSFVAAQIHSVLAQSYKDWRLVVHDDGSSDDTLDIVRRLADRDSRVVIVADGRRFGNAAENFMHLLKFSDAPCVMFCDQDDIWFDNKVAMMVECISSMDLSRPCVAYSDSYVWRPEEGIKGHTMLYQVKTLQSFLFMNGGVQGCASIFNAPMRDLLLRWNVPLAMHDHILELAALSLGEVRYVGVPLMLYRNHANNVTGNTKTARVDRNSFACSSRPVVRRAHYDAVVAFRRLYGESIPAPALRVIDDYISLPSRGRLARMISVVRGGYNIYGSRIHLWCKMLLRPYMG